MVTVYFRYNLCLDRVQWREIVFWGMLALCKQIVLTPAQSSKYFCISVFSHLSYINIYVCVRTELHEVAAYISDRVFSTSPNFSPPLYSLFS